MRSLSAFAISAGSDILMGVKTLSAVRGVRSDLYQSCSEVAGRHAPAGLIAGRMPRGVGA